jgi:hypothetical protein
MISIRYEFQAQACANSIRRRRGATTKSKSPPLHRATVNPADCATEPLAVFGDEMRGQQRNVFGAFPQWRQMMFSCSN